MMFVRLSWMFFATFGLFASPLFSEDLCSLDHAIVAIYAVDTKSGKVLVEKNRDLSLMPASCMKIVTTAAALHVLGADYRFETHLEYDGTIDQDKILHGNLYIRGGGDPCLGSERMGISSSWEKQIDTWVDAVRALGIKKIEGSVIGDATKWEKALAVPSWAWEDLGNYYGAGACALSFHENCYSLFFQPDDQVGNPASLLRTDPPISTLDFESEVKTGPEGSGDNTCIYGSEFSPVQFIRGTIPAAVKEFAIRGVIPDPPVCCAELLSQKLQKKGIFVSSKKIEPQTKRVSFHVTYSPTVREIVYWTNQKSVNLYAEHLLKKMGEVVFNEGSTAGGVKAVVKFWDSQQIDLSGFNMVDGSGLSRKNLVTATQFVQMLSKMKDSVHFPAFFESLPYQASARAKSGTMSLIKGYVGYSGDIAFAVLINQYANREMINKKMSDFLAYLETAANE